MMSMLSISCPSCGFSRQIPTDRVPDGPRRVTCPKCKHVFAFTKPVGMPIPPAEAVQPPPPPTPPQPPEPPTPLDQPADADSKDPSQTPPPVRRRTRPPPPKKLKDMEDLFKESWQLFQRRFAVLIGLYLLTIIAFTLPIGMAIGLSLLAGVFTGGVAAFVAGAIGLVVGIYFGFHCFAAFLQAVVNDQLSFGQSLEKGKEFTLSLIWISFLTGFIISGGFILLIVPGIIFMVWFFFAQFIMVRENLRGMSSLLKSREYVRGEWFNVALRLLLVWAASGLLGMIPLAGPLLCIAFFPFVMIFHNLLYLDLQEMKGEIPYSCGTADIIKWPAVAAIGFIVVPALLVSFLGFTMFDKFAKFAPPGSTINFGTPAVKTGNSNDKGLRVINFPQKDGSGLAATPTGAGTLSTTAAPSTSDSQSSPARQEEYPDNIHVFIYAVNYTGTVRANGSTIKEMEGKPDVQYNYNMDGKGLRYGENQIEVEYAELTGQPSTLLGVQITVTRNTPGKGKETLGDWRLNEKGTGRKTFTFDIPK